MSKLIRIGCAVEVTGQETTAGLASFRAGWCAAPLDTITTERGEDDVLPIELLLALE
jgi:hypothetical protein